MSHFIRSSALVSVLALALTGCRSSAVARHLPVDAVEVAALRTDLRDAEWDGTSDNGFSKEDDRDPVEDKIEKSRGRVGFSPRISGNDLTAWAKAHATGNAIEQVAAEDTVNPAPLRLSIFQAIETSLAANPDLLTQREAEAVSLAALGVAQTYPFNPSLQVQVTPFQDLTSPTSHTTNHYVLLMQQVQLAHQQDHREHAACSQLNSVRWNLLQAQLQTVAQTERLYFTALTQKGLLDLARTTAENNSQLLRIVERRLEAGDVSAADVSLVRLDDRTTRQQTKLAEANYQTALLDLRRQLALSPAVALELDADLDAMSWKPAAEAFGSVAFRSANERSVAEQQTTLTVSSLAINRPDVMAAQADIDAARAGLCLADANRTPDLQIGPYYQRTADGSSYYGLRGQMDIPVLNSGHPAVRQREAELRQRVQFWHQLQTKATLEAEAATERYERARAMVADAEYDPASSIPVELQQLEKQFQANEVDVLRVMQARNSLIQNRRVSLDARNELCQSAVALAVATGLPLDALLTLVP